MFNWFRRNKEEVPTEPLNTIYNTKGIANVGNKNPKKPWVAYIDIDNRYKRKNGAKHNIHIGYFSTKEEAEIARWEFIENLK